LVETLRSADPEVRCWSFLPAPSPLAFWARRQAHETAIHRVDAESPNGAITPFDTALAADGVDEMLFGFLGRPSTDDGSGPERPMTLHLHATDTDGEWLVRLSRSGVEAAREHAEADCEV